MVNVISYKTDLDQHDDIKIKTKFKHELCKKEKHRIIAQELKQM